MQRKAAAGKQKWVPKGAEGDEEGMENIDVSSSPILSAKSEGPCFDKIVMLKFFEAAQKHGEDQEDDGEKIDVGLKERPTKDTEGKTPGSRRALREAKKAAKRADGGSEEYEYELETAGGEISLAAAMQDMISGDAHPSQADIAAHHVQMMQWLHSMAFASPMACGIPPGPNGYTTVMLRNIPNRYTRDMLIERLNETHKGQYDFVYLPIDFNSKCNVGYAFINFRNPSAASIFTQEFHGKRTNTVLPGFSSAKVCQVSYARVQGRDANMENLRDEKFIEKLHERPEWQPLFYDEDGKEVPFAKTLGTGGGKKKKQPQTPVAGMYPTWTYQPPWAYSPFPTPTGPSLSLSTVLPSATAETMLMLKEVPASVTQAKMIELLDKSVKGAYDFLYLPKDTKAEGNRGFVFVNFKMKDKAELFTKEYNGKKVTEVFPDEEGDAEKTCEVVGARLHSLEGSILRSQASKKAEGQWAPALFSPDGEQLPFPQLGSQGSKGQPKTNGASEEADKSEEEKKEEGEGKGKGKKNGEGKGAKGEGKGTKGEGKGVKGEGKGKKDKTPKTPTNTPMGYNSPYGFPPGYNVAYMAHAMAMQQIMTAHTAAHAAAAKYAHAGPSGAPTPKIEKGKKTPTEAKEGLKTQIEFYFSAGNLCHDMFLRKHMDTDTGFVPLELIAEFPKVKKFKSKMADIQEMMGASGTLELDETKKLIRLKDEAERKRWAAPDAAAEESK